MGRRQQQAGCVCLVENDGETSEAKAGRRTAAFKAHLCPQRGQTPAVLALPVVVECKAA